MKASELKKQLTKISLMSNEIAIKDAITRLIQEVKSITYEESQKRTISTIEDADEVKKFILKKISASDPIGKKQLTKETSRDLCIPMVKVDALLNQMAEEGIIAKDKDAPRACNRAIIYKRA